MERLRQQDMKAMLEFLPEVYSLRNAETFGRNIIAAMPRLIPCHISALLRGDATGHPQLFIYPEAITMGEAARAHELSANHMMEVPIFRIRLIQGVYRSSKNSDHIGHVNLHRLNIYNELYSHYRVEDSLDCSLSDRSQPAFNNILALHRDKDFDNRDKLMLEGLRPHLSQGLQNAQALSGIHAQLAQLGDAVGSMNRGIVMMNEDGRAQLVTPLAYAWLAKYFGRPPRTNGLPDTVQRWFWHEKAKLAAADDIPPPLAPLIVERDGKTLVVRLTANSDGDLLVLEEHAPRTSPRAILERFSVTGREAEVLYWVAEGKTNGEIGTILSMSPRTVAKHLEHIYQKIGVETRTAAATIVVEALR